MCVLQDEPCRYNPQGVGASDYGYLDLAKGDEVTLQAAMAEIGPVAVAIDASSDTFMNYRYGGLFFFQTRVKCCGQAPSPLPNKNQSSVLNFLPDCVSSPLR